MTFKVYIENSLGEQIRCGDHVQWTGKIGKRGWDKTKGIRTGVVQRITQEWRQFATPDTYHTIIVEPDGYDENGLKVRMTPIRLGDLSNIQLKKEANENS